jgi:hypothetical protein
MNASRHEVMALVAQHANDLGRQAVLRTLTAVSVSPVAFGHGAAGNAAAPLRRRRRSEWLFERFALLIGGFLDVYLLLVASCIHTLCATRRQRGQSEQDSCRRGGANLYPCARRAFACTQQSVVQFLQCTGKSL